MAGRKRLKARGRGIFRTRYSCCGKTFHGIHANRAQKAHHLAAHSGRWTSDQARKAARKMGKPVDLMRRHARSWQEAAGLRDQRGNLTAKARSRPLPRGRVTLRQMRQLHRHDRDHERADRHARKAAAARTRDRHDKAIPRERRARGLRGRWPELRPVRPARTPPARTPAGTRSNGTRPAPARTRTP